MRLALADLVVLPGRSGIELGGAAEAVPGQDLCGIDQGGASDFVDVAALTNTCHVAADLTWAAALAANAGVDAAILPFNAEPCELDEPFKEFSLLFGN
jgi:hypothetical protein